MLETVCTLAGVPTERISDVITSHFSSRVVASAEAITSGPAALIDNPLLRCVWARKCGGRDVYPVGAVVDALLAFVKEEAQVEDGQYAGDAVALAKCLDRNSDGMVRALLYD